MDKPPINQIEFSLKDLCHSGKSVLRRAYVTSRIEALEIYLYEKNSKPIEDQRTLRVIEKSTFQSHIAEQYLVHYYDFYEDIRQFMDIIGKPAKGFKEDTYDVYTGKDSGMKRQQLMDRRAIGNLVANHIITLEYSEGTYRYRSITSLPK